MSSDTGEEEPMTIVAPEVAQLTFEVHGRIPIGVLTVDDVPGIDLNVPFELQDGELLIMAAPSAWHDAISNSVRGYLQQRCAHAAEDMIVAVGRNGRRPDVVGLSVSLDELLRTRAKVLASDVVDVAVEVISHDDDPVKDHESVSRDRDVKFREYASAGILEYWIVDEVAEDFRDASVEIYRLQAGAYVPVRITTLSELLAEMR